MSKYDKTGCLKAFKILISTAVITAIIICLFFKLKG